jgi:hypothetical protein
MHLYITRRKETLPHPPHHILTSHGHHSKAKAACTTPTKFYLNYPDKMIKKLLFPKAGIGTF